MNKKLVYVDNRTIVCSVCDKLRYMGITTKNDSELCNCRNQDKIQVYDKSAPTKELSLIEKYAKYE